MSNLDNLTDAFLRQKMQANPPAGYEDAEMALNAFVAAMQEQGVDLGKWSEADWRVNLLKFGFDHDEVNSALENIGGWGVVDNFVYETETEQAVEEEVRSAVEESK